MSLNVYPLPSYPDNREYAAAAAPAAKQNVGKITAVIGAVVDVQVPAVGFVGSSFAFSSSSKCSRYIVTSRVRLFLKALDNVC